MVLDNDDKHFVIGVQWLNAIHNGAHNDHIEILDAKIRGLTIEKSKLKYNIGVFLDLKSEAWESCTLNPGFLIWIV